MEFCACCRTRAARRCSDSKYRPAGARSRAAPTWRAEASLVPVTNRDSPIAHPWADQPIVGILLESVRDPTGGATDGEDRGRQSTRESQHPGGYRQIKIEVGTEPLTLPDCFFDTRRDLQQPASSAPPDGLGVLAQ